MKRVAEKLSHWLFKSIGLFHSQTIIYFESFHGSQYSDNPRAIYEWMKQHHPEYTYVWGVKKGCEKPFLDKRINYITRFSIKWFLTMPRAKTWVMNTRTPLWLHKNPKTTYMQTWHGTPLKTIGCDIPSVSIPGYTKESYEKEFKEESDRWDYLVSPNAYSSTIFKRAFSYQGLILEIGYPRNDLLVKAQQDSGLKEQIKSSLGLNNNQKVILYAPTWRETAEKKSGKYCFQTDFPFEELIKTLDKHVTVLVRMHYLAASSIDFKQYQGYVKDVSQYEDMSELLAVADLLITDYSSCFFDFALTNQPMLFFIPDQEEYETQMRGFYFSMEENVPGKLVKTKSDLLDQISQWQKEPNDLLAPNYQSFKETYTKLEQGHSSKRACEWLLKKGES